jgi:hypothetical protein
MDQYVHFVLRRLAALRGLQYGRLIGITNGTPGPMPFADTWPLDPAKLDALLRDERFIT